MFNHLRGRLMYRTPARVVVETGGVGYELAVSLSTYENLPTDGDVTLLVHLQLRDDKIRLFGFLTEQERDLFRLLLTVSGIGPVLALSVLSGSDVESLQQSIVSEDVSSLTRIRGIGARTARRMVLELKPALTRQGVAAGALSGRGGKVLNDAMAALVSLGYTRSRAEKAITSAAEKLGSQTAVEDLVRQGLKER